MLHQELESTRVQVFRGGGRQDGHGSEGVRKGRGLATGEGLDVGVRQFPFFAVPQGLEPA